MAIGRFLLFLLVVVGIMGGVHFIVWARLVRDVALPAPWGRVLTWAIWGLCGLVPASFFLVRLAPRWLASPILWVVYVWLGFLFFLFFTVIPSELVRVAARFLVTPPDPERRLFLSRAFAAVVGVTAGGAGVAALFGGLRKVDVKNVTVPLAKLPKGLDGYTIVQLSDVHVGPTIGKAFIDDLVARVNALKPDLVAITGDLVDGSVHELGPCVAALADLKARDGVYFVTGNHEYYSGADDWIAHLRKLGVRVLQNERVPVRGVDGFDLAGVDDASATMDLDAALTGRDPSRLLVLLAHQPKAILKAALHRIDLQLSGHTHGGQLWPWGHLVKLDQPYVAGLHRHDSGAHIYVSQGTGYWGPPMRLGAPAEITRIELTPA